MRRPQTKLRRPKNPTAYRSRTKSPGIQNANSRHLPTVPLKALLEARQQATDALASATKAEARIREALDFLPQGVVFLDSEGKYILWNQQYAEIYKRSADLFKPGVKLADTLRVGIARGDYPDAVGREEEWLAERLNLLTNPRGRHEQRLSDGRWIMIEECRTSDGGTIGLRVDITEMKERAESFRLLFENNPVPMFVCAKDDFHIIAANDAAIEHYGYDSQAIMKMALGDIQCDTTDTEFSAIMEGSDDGLAGKTWKHKNAKGDMLDVAIFARSLTYENKPAALIAAIDITERKRAETKIAFLAHHDALTSLPNRAFLQKAVEDILAGFEEEDSRVAFLCVDLDNFKVINDTLGHPFGDLLLQAVTARIKTLLSADDILARIGGDEFAIIHTNVGQAEQVSAFAQHLIAEMSEPFELDGHRVLVGTSVGIALAPSDGSTFEKLFKCADLALYRAKAESRGTFRFFEAEMDARAQARHRIEIDLRTALQEGGLEVHYQPLVSLETTDVVGFEALVRWPHPERGMIPPMDFIPIAEETGLMSGLGAFVLEQACRDAATWPKPVKISVNLSPIQFRYGNLLKHVMHALQVSGLSPQRLDLEITETLLLEKSEYVFATLHALRALGVSISMDDFGTGYSSLSSLLSFPFDKIKIDKSFVQNLSRNAESQAIVRAIVNMGKSLGKTITAEGIENDEDLHLLQLDGCDQGQGFLFSKARPANEIFQFLTTKRLNERRTPKARSAKN